MAFLTAIQRIRKGVSNFLWISKRLSIVLYLKAFENHEDAGANVELKKDENVERVRRAHLNDLENIPPFLVAALFYVMTEPQPDVGLWLIRIAVLARIGHTIVSHAIFLVLFLKKNIIFYHFSGVGLRSLSNTVSVLKRSTKLLSNLNFSFWNTVNQQEEFALGLPSW